MNHDIVALANSVAQAFENKGSFKMVIPWQVYEAVLDELGRRSKPKPKTH